MSDIDVRAYLDQLRSNLPYVPPLPTGAIESLHKKRDFGGVVRIIRRTMNVGVNLTVHWTSETASDLPRARAWIEIPENMPYYGTAKFKEMKLNVFILKSFRDASRHDEFAIAVAHELSHVVLESIQHPLRHEEKAVDLTAMLLGFSDLYRKTAHTVRWLDDKQFERRQLGYLSPTELEEACRILLPTRMRARHVVSKRAEANGGRLFLLGSCAAIALAILASNEWDKYQLASTEAANIASEVPRKLNPFTTLVSVHAGLASVTRQFVVTIPKYRIGDLAAFQSRLRTTACAREGRNIERGLSYVYDYRNPEGEQIAHFKVSSCP